MRILAGCVGAVLFVFSISSFVCAGEFVEKGSVAGAGVMFLESPYRGVDEDAYAVPVLVAEAKRFFVDSTVMGYYFNDRSSPFRWAVIGSLRSQGYEADDSNDLGGMQDRDWAFDAGARLNWKNGIVDMNLEAVTDVSGTHEGREIRLVVSKTMFEGFLTPKAGVRWQSADLVDYYYGVRHNEVRAGRAEYSAHDDLEYMIGMTMGVPLGDTWALFGDVGCTFLGDEAGDSPIVSDDALMRYVAGVVYRF